MNKNIVYLLAVFASISISACNGSGGGGDNDVSAFTQVSDLTADSEPAFVDNAVEVDINAIFGDQDSTATDVVQADEVRDVIDRARGG